MTTRVDDAVSAVPRVSRLPLSTAVTTALLVMLSRPSAWTFALAGFLARGGFLVLGLPIVVLPTPSGISNVIAEPVTPLLFGTVTPDFVMLVIAVVVVATVVLVGGAVIGAWAERQGIHTALEVGAEEGIVDPVPDDLVGRSSTVQVAILRLIGLIPVGLTIVLSSRVLYDGIYHELILPEELRTPLVVRVMSDMPGQLVTIALTWLIADAATALGVRRLVLERRSIRTAWLLGWVGVISRPHRVLAMALIAVGVTLLVLVPAVAATFVGWGRVRVLLEGGEGPIDVTIAVVLFIAVWLGAIVLAGATTAFRNAVWTFEVTRRAGPSSPPA